MVFLRLVSIDNQTIISERNKKKQIWLTINEMKGKINSFRESTIFSPMKCAYLTNGLEKMN